ncbi:unnamed protein product, partial [Amoebophrya sp. A120]|eukprot:GSA120T00001871001.1
MARGNNFNKGAPSSRGDTTGDHRPRQPSQRRSRGRGGERDTRHNNRPRSSRDERRRESVARRHHRSRSHERNNRDDHSGRDRQQHRAQDKNDRQPDPRDDQRGRGRPRDNRSTRNQESSRIIEDIKQEHDFMTQRGGRRQVGRGLHQEGREEQLHQEPRRNSRADEGMNYSIEQGNGKGLLENVANMLQMTSEQQYGRDRRRADGGEEHRGRGRDRKSSREQRKREQDLASYNGSEQHQQVEEKTYTKKNPNKIPLGAGGGSKNHKRERRRHEDENNENHSSRNVSAKQFKMSSENPNNIPLGGGNHTSKRVVPGGKKDSPRKKRRYDNPNDIPLGSPKHSFLSLPPPRASAAMASAPELPVPDAECDANKLGSHTRLDGSNSLLSGEEPRMRAMDTDNLDGERRSHLLLGGSNPTSSVNHENIEDFPSITNTSEDYVYDYTHGKADAGCDMRLLHNSDGEPISGLSAAAATSGGYYPDPDPFSAFSNVELYSEKRNHDDNPGVDQDQKKIQCAVGSTSQLPGSKNVGHVEDRKRGPSPQKEQGTKKFKLKKRKITGKLTVKDEKKQTNFEGGGKLSKSTSSAGRVLAGAGVQLSRQHDQQRDRLAPADFLILKTFGGRRLLNTQDVDDVEFLKLQNLSKAEFQKKLNEIKMRVRKRYREEQRGPKIKPLIKPGMQGTIWLKTKIDNGLVEKIPLYHCTANADGSIDDDDVEWEAATSEAQRLLRIVVRDPNWESPRQPAVERGPGCKHAEEKTAKDDDESRPEVDEQLAEEAGGGSEEDRAFHAEVRTPEEAEPNLLQDDPTTTEANATPDEEDDNKVDDETGFVISDSELLYILNMYSEGTTSSQIGNNAEVYFQPLYNSAEKEEDENKQSGIIDMRFPPSSPPPVGLEEV